MICFSRHQITSIIFENEKKKGQIKVIKTDGETEYPLEGVTFVIEDSKGNEVDKKTGIASTFMRIKLIIEEVEYDELVIVIKGDITGDGEVTGPDNVKLQNYMLMKIDKLN